MIWWNEKSKEKLLNFIRNIKIRNVDFCKFYINLIFIIIVDDKLWLDVDDSFMWGILNI